MDERLDDLNKGNWKSGNSDIIGAVMECKQAVEESAVIGTGGLFKELILILHKAALSESEEWEQRPDWESAICVPVKNHALAPRDALAILEVFGIMSDRGFDLPEIFKVLFDDFTKLRWAEILTHGTE